MKAQRFPTLGRPLGTKVRVTYMATDQHGQTEHDLGPHPRAELLKRCGRKHAAKMYSERAGGSDYHSGYIIAGRWFRLFRVEPFEGAAP